MSALLLKLKYKKPNKEEIQDVNDLFITGISRLEYLLIKGMSQNIQFYNTGLSSLIPKVSKQIYIHQF